MQETKQRQGNRNVWAYSVAGFCVALIIAFVFWSRLANDPGSGTGNPTGSSPPAGSAGSAGGATAPSAPPGIGSTGTGPHPGSGIVPGRQEDTEGTKP